MDSFVTARILDLAPFCSIPPRDGADRRAWGLFNGLNDAGCPGLMISRLGVYRDRELTEPASRLPEERGKLWSAISALCLGKDYWQQKLLTPRIKRLVRTQRNTPFDCVILNFLFCQPLLKHLNMAQAGLIVDTHNYDPAIFSGFRDSSRNPFQRFLCNRAIHNSRRALRQLPARTVMVHVSEEDAAAWKRDRPDLSHLVVENGCDVRPRATRPRYDGGERRRLMFVGSLSAQMNQDALMHFADCYWPKLADACSMRVIGSNPPPRIGKLCERLRWELRPNVDEAELEASYLDVHFSILPFEYGAGSKLKLMEACGRGVPVLSTKAGTTGVRRLPSGVRVGNGPDQWLCWITEDLLDMEAEAHQLVEFASEFSWTSLGRRYARVVAAVANRRGSLQR